MTRGRDRTTARQRKRTNRRGYSKAEENFAAAQTFRLPVQSACRTGLTSRKLPRVFARRVGASDMKLVVQIVELRKKNLADQVLDDAVRHR
jgi:hypothetical protein